MDQPAIVNSDLLGLVARFRTLAEHPPVPVERLTYLTGQVCAQIARTTGTTVRVSRTPIGCTVRFYGPRANDAQRMLRRQMGSVTGQIVAAATDTILEELGAG